MNTKLQDLPDKWRTENIKPFKRGDFSYDFVESAEACADELEAAIAEAPIFSEEELRHLDLAMFYYASKRRDFFEYTLLKDTRARNGHPPTKGQRDAARQDSDDADALLTKIRKLRNPNYPQ